MSTLSRLLSVRDHNPEVVDDLIAAMELQPLQLQERPEQWLDRQQEAGLLPTGNYAYLDLLLYGLDQ